MPQISHLSPKCLYPLGCLYGWGVRLRNFCFDQGWIRSRSYPIPVICVGNITAGGTGKTPHVEYLLTLLGERYRMAVLTRGYGRRTKGLVVAEASSSVEEVGDEPRQIKRKYPHVMVIVDGNRCRAMDYLMGLSEAERPQVVVMDDGFQHRYIRPSYSIVLVDATQPVWEERLLPCGHLREPLTALDRADCVIATKCPTDMPPIGQRIIKRSLKLFPHQRIYFSRIKYQPLRPLVDLLTEEVGLEASPPPQQGAPVIQLTGIANSEPLEAYLGKQYRVIDKWVYRDHYPFSPSDVWQWSERARDLSEGCASWAVVCTEKDAMRLLDIASSIPQDFLTRIYYLPISIQILDKEKDFIHLIGRLAGGK